MVETLVIAAATYAVGYALSKPEIKIWLPGLPPLEFNNPLFKTPEGQRLGDMKIQDTAEGAPENRCFGPKNRIAGALVWMSDLKEVKKSESGAGKGGSGGEFITYQYFAHVMIRMCRAKTPISRIPKLWADGKILYDAEVDVSISSTGIAASISSSVIYIGAPFLIGEVTRNYLLLSSDIAVGGRPDLSTVKSGNVVTVSGYTGGTVATTPVQCHATPGNGNTTINLRTSSGTFALLADDVLEFQGYSLSYSVKNPITVTTAGVVVDIHNTIVQQKPIGSVTAPVAVTVKRGNQVNNGTFSVVSSSKNPEPGVTQISQVKLTDQSNPFRKFVAIALGPTVVITQDNPTFKSSQVGEVNLLTGGPDQAVPAILQQIEGPNVSQVYAMRFRAGIVLRDLNLTDFGNRVPNIEGLVEVTADPGKVADAISTILTDDAQWPASAIDVSLVTGELLGFSISGPQPPTQSLLSLMIAFDIAQWERGGKLYFANRSALIELEIPIAEVGSFVDRQERQGLQVVDQARDFLPSHFDVRYRSEEKEYQTATKRSMRSEDIPVNIRGINLESLVLDDDAAQQIADKMLALAWGAQHKLTCPLPQSRIGQIREGMILRFGPIYGQTWRMFVERLDRGANMLMVASGQEYDPSLLVQAGTSEGSLGISTTGNTQDHGGMSQPMADLLLMDIPSLTAEHRHEPGVYVAARSADPTRAWRGAVLYWSRDDGLSWHRVLDVLTESVTGEVITPPATSVMPGMWDRVNTIRVRIRHPQAQLGGVTEQECLDGANRFIIGREIIGAASVIFVERDPVDGSKVYDLSVLMRGQQDTTQEMETAVAGDPVVWLDGPGVQFLPLSYSAVDQTRLWRLVPHGGNVEDALDVRAAITARNCKPFHVVDVVGIRDGSNNLALTWSPLSRAAPQLFEQGDPLDEELEVYEIDVVFSGAVVRTIIVAGPPTVTYTAAEQTADGITPGDPVTLRFYQMSVGFLRGQESEYEV